MYITVLWINVPNDKHDDKDDGPRVHTFHVHIHVHIHDIHTCHNTCVLVLVYTSGSQMCA